MKSTKTDNDTEIGLHQENRKTITKRLTQLLADQQILNQKLRNYHWNVMGMFFKPLHAFFEEQYNMVSVQIDDIAERIRSLGFFSIGSMQAYLSNTRLTETGHLEGNAIQMLKNILEDHESIIRTLRDDIKVTQELGDEGTTDFLIGLMEAHEKMAWMVRSHLG